MGRLLRNVAVHDENGEAIWFGPAYGNAESVPTDVAELIPASFFEDIEEPEPVKPKRGSKPKSTPEAKASTSDPAGTGSDAVTPPLSGPAAAALPIDLDPADEDAVLAWVNETQDPDEYVVRVAAASSVSAELAARLEA